MLIVTRVYLQGVDARLITWYSLDLARPWCSSALSLLLSWQPPATVVGWIVIVLLGIAITTGILGVFASTARIGPFRTALFMNLEPLLDHHRQRRPPGRSGSPRCRRWAAPS